MPHKKSKDAKQGESKVHPFIGNEEISERTECIRCRRKQTGCRHDVCFRMRTDSRQTILDGDAGKHSGERTIGSGRG